MSKVHIRPYSDADHSAGLALFNSNRPKYFAEDELGPFRAHLKKDREVEPYFVAECDGQVRACGGFFSNGFGVAYLAWGMVEQSWHRRGVGSALLEWRLRDLREDRRAWCVLIDTSQHTAPFYERFGFITFRQIDDGYEPGLHKIYMRLVWDDPA